MRIESNILLLSYKDIVPIVLNVSAYKQALHRHQLQTTHRACIGKPVEIIYDSLPARYKAKLPSKELLIKQCEANQTETKSTETLAATAALISLHESKFTSLSDFQYYRFKKSLNNAKAHDLMQACGWLRLLSAYKTPSQCRIIGFNTKQDLRQTIIDHLKSLKLPIYKFRIANMRTLQNRELEWQKLIKSSLNEALDAQMHQGIGNDNSRRIGKISIPEDAILLPGANIDLGEFHAGTLFYLYTNPGAGNIFDFEEIYKRYIIRCDEREEKPRSLSAVKQFLSRDDVQQYTLWERKGFKEIDKILPGIVRERPQYSLSKGGVDGFQVDFYTDIDSKSRTMLTCVAFFDLKTEAITGYEIVVNESGHAVRNAYRNHLRKFGKAYCEIESDRGSSIIGKDSAALLGRFSKFNTTGGPSDPRGIAPNPKRRLAERLILELNRLTQSIPGWKGTNITSQRHHAGKPNPDYGIPAQESLEMGITCINKLIALYNHQALEKFDGKSRMQLCQEAINPEAMEVSPEMLAFTFNKSTITAVRNSLVTITVAKKDFVYPFPENLDLTNRLAKGRRVKVYFDETDMETVDIFGFTDEKDPDTDYYLATLGKVIRVQGAKAEQKHADLAELGRQSHIANEYKEKIERKMLETEAAQYELDITGCPPIADLRKLVYGARSRFRDTIVLPFDKRHEAVLTTEAAQADIEWNTQVSLRDKNLRPPSAPSPFGEGRGEATSRKEYLLNRIKNNKKP